MMVSPARPSYLEYHIPPDVWSVVVRAQSGDNLCGVMSVQEVKVTIIILTLQYRVYFYCRLMYADLAVVLMSCYQPSNL